MISRKPGSANKKRTGSVVSSSSKAKKRSNRLTHSPRKTSKLPKKAANSIMSNDEAQKAAKQIFDAVPDGTTVSYEDFCKKVDPTVAKLLPWVTPKTISRRGKHLTLVCASATTHKSHGIEVKTAKTIQFDLAASAGAVVLTNIDGIKVSPSNALPSLELKEARLSKNKDGNKVINGKLRVSAFLPMIPFTVTLGDDGKPITDK